MILPLEAMVRILLANPEKEDIFLRNQPSRAMIENDDLLPKRKLTNKISKAKIYK